MKDRLVDLITIGLTRACIKEASGKKVDQAREIADVLIANGVVVPSVKAGSLCMPDVAERWEKNLERLMSGGFGDPIHAETLLYYWYAQERARYPYASENVKYFEEMCGIHRKELGMPDENNKS